MNNTNFLDNFIKIKEQIPELKFFGEKPLHSKSENVTLEEAKEIVEKLTKAILKYREITGLGRGIAAPQIGLQKNVFITYIDNQVQVYVNPFIIKQSEETNFYRELCMSSSLIWSDVERPSSIVITFTDENGKTQTKEYTNLMARLLQHEQDHLNGCVCLDKAVKGTISFVDSNPANEEIRKNAFNLN